jgi:hypothetical protein
MPVLHVDDVPEELYRRIAELAANDRVPLSEETVRLLRMALQFAPPAAEVQSRAQVQEVLDRMWRNRIVPSPETPDSLEMLREDRGR